MYVLGKENRQKLFCNNTDLPFKSINQKTKQNKQTEKNKKKPGSGVVLH